jgi:hypothetical protein
MSRPDEATRYLQSLAACGWFEGLPAGAAQAARDGVTASVAEGDKPWFGLVCATPDSAYLLEDRPYTALLRQFAEASHGAFAPEEILEEPEQGAVRFSYRAAGREYRLSLPGDAFDVPDAFFDTINDAMKASGTPLRFLRIHELGWGPIPGYVLTTPAAFRRASAAKLVAAEEPPVIPSDEELDAISANVTTRLMDYSETFPWVLDGLTVLEMQVPRGHEAEDNDGRKQGEGRFTLLAYQKAGTLMLQCAAPAGDHVGPPKGFRVSERLERHERLIVRGTARLAGVDVVWRQDTFKGLPVHLNFCVTKEWESTFAEALDSARLHESTPEREALFQSCLASAPAAKKKTAAQKRR